MIGPQYWTTGISLRWDSERWSAWLDFFDDGWCTPDSTEGRLSIRYCILTEALPFALDTLIADAKRLNISFKRNEIHPTLYVRGDGEDSDEIYHPKWKEILSEQCQRLGFRDVYAEISSPKESE